MALHLALAARTDVGMVRQNNEDNFLLIDLSRDAAALEDHCERSVGPNGVLAMVADGMGGAAAGEIASRMALDEVSRSLIDQNARATPEDANQEDLLEQAFKVSNKALYERAVHDVKVSGMGTTLTCVWIRGSSAHIGQVGDSRAYVVRNGRIQQLTEDQSLREHLIAEESITPEQAERRAPKNVIMQAIGVRPDIDPATLTIPLYTGDVMLLCSDGLIETVSDGQILATLTSGGDLDDLAQRLVSEANAEGGPDNITVVLVGVESLDEALDEPLGDRPFDLDQTLQLPGAKKERPKDAAEAIDGSGQEETLTGEDMKEKPGGASHG